MNIRQAKSVFPVAACAVLGLAAASGQTPDSSQNASLSGTYQFRHVAVQAVDSNYNPTEVTASYGTITFSGSGTYTLTGFTVDNTISNGVAQPLTAIGTYAIGANGMGYVSNPLYPTDTFDFDYGAFVQGVFTGSATEAEQEGYVVNDIFIAIPAASITSNAGFANSYQTGLLDFTSGGSTAVKNALFELIPNGSGGLGTISLSGQASNQSQTLLTQTVTGATYSPSSGGLSLNIPLASGTTSTTALFTGTKTAYVSSNGNFILGYTPSGYDVFFGVKALTSTVSSTVISGLFYTAGMDDSVYNYGLDSYYGGLSGSGDTTGDSIVHARLNYPDEYAFDYGTDNVISVNSNGSTGIDYDGYQYLIGNAGQAFVGIGTGANTTGSYSLIIGLHAATFTGSGVYINPVGIVNAASYQPITAPLSPGELLTIFGSGLSSGTVTTQGGQAFPTTLNKVSATINSIPCPIYYVSPTQMSIVVPYAIASNTTGYANVQVTNNGVASNIVQMYHSDSMPGSFSQNANGLGYAAALHALTGQLITTSNPAVPGEYVSLYLTGLGTVTPNVTDGALGPVSPLSTADLNTAGNLSVNFNDYTNGNTEISGTILYAGLAPGLAGLYQINVQVPSTGINAGDSVEVEFVTDMSDVNQIYLPFGSSALDRPVKDRVFGVGSRITKMRAAPKKAQFRPVRGGVAVGRCDAAESRAKTKGCIQ
jgi:uncharacterized protein (TIGR03437 family)